MNSSLVVCKKDWVTEEEKKKEQQENGKEIGKSYQRSDEQKESKGEKIKRKAVIIGGEERERMEKSRRG